MPTLRDACRPDGPHTLVAVRVLPGTRQEGPSDVRMVPPARGGAPRALLVWHIRARAVDGRANAALVRSVAGYLDARPGAVEVIRGDRAREKLLLVRDHAVSEVVARLSGHDRGAYTR